MLNDLRGGTVLVSSWFRKMDDGVPRAAARTLNRAVRTMMPLVLLPIGASAQTPGLSAVSSWRCEFPSMATAEWEPGGLDASITQQEDFRFHIDGVDLPNSHARMIGNVGSADLVAIPGHGAIHFLEQAPAGNLIVTTIFAAVNGSFPATHSRHVAIFPGTSPAVSQAYGQCMPWE